MSNRRRHTLALLLSVVGHVTTVVGFSGGLTCIPNFDVPEIELEFTEIELIDPQAIQGDEAQPDPEPPPPAPEPPPAEPPTPTPVDPASEETKPPEPEKKDEEPPPEKKKFADKGSRADKLAPPTSTFHMLLVPRKIRRLPFKQKVLDIMAPLPDFEYLIDKGRFDALRDFDHIVIASPDIRDWTQTFLAVDYTISREEVQRGIERAAAANGEIIEWVEDDGLLRGNPRPADPEEEDADNRWFVFLEGKVAIYVRDEFLPSILEGPADDDRKTTGNFVASLTRMRRFAGRQPKAGMQIVLKDIRRNLKRSNLPFQVPDEFEISASAAKEPELLIRGQFVNVVEAKAFLKWYEEIQQKVQDSFSLRMQVGWIFDLLEVERDGRRVELRGVFSTEQAELVMKFAADGSRKVAGKTPEEVEEMKRRRIEAMKARRGGKLPPSALDPVAETPADPGGPTPTPRTPASPGGDSKAEKPAKTDAGEAKGEENAG